MKKEKIKTIAASAACLGITAAVTCGVLFLPSVYYSAADKKKDDGSITETFSPGTEKTAVTGDEFLKMAFGDDAIWVENDSAEADVESISQAVYGFAEAMGECSTSQLIEKLCEEVISGENIVSYSEVTLSAPIVDETASVDAYTAEFQVTSDNNTIISVSVFVNKTSGNIVYDFTAYFYEECDLAPEAIDGEDETAVNILNNLYDYWQSDDDGTFTQSPYELIISFYSYGIKGY